jgi:hypothetical protein
LVVCAPAHVPTLPGAERSSLEHPGTFRAFEGRFAVVQSSSKSRCDWSRVCAHACPCVVRCVGDSSLWCDERCRRKRLAPSRSVSSRATARLVGVDFGRAWLTLEHVRVLGPRADAAVVASACT